MEFFLSEENSKTTTCLLYLPLNDTRERALEGFVKNREEFPVPKTTSMELSKSEFSRLHKIKLHCTQDKAPFLNAENKIITCLSHLLLNDILGEFWYALLASPILKLFGI